MKPDLFTPRRIRSFWAKVDTTAGLFGCWPWQGAVDRWGYGRFTVKPHELGAHRAAYLLTHGPITQGMQVCHTCDNSICCNPAHLYEGTPAANMADRSERGRAWIGRSGKPVGTLTAADVGRLRAARSREEINELARAFGVHERTAQDAAYGRTWLDHPDPSVGAQGEEGPRSASASRSERGAALATQPA